MANPQLEDGYTRIANELLEATYRYKFNASQLAIIMCVWRFTFGFQRKRHAIAVSFISDATGLHKKQVQREINTLFENNVLQVEKEATNKTAREIKINKNYIEWTIEFRGSELDPSRGSGLVPSNDDLEGANSLPKKESKSLKKEKEIYTTGGVEKMASISNTKLEKSRVGKTEYAESVWLKPEEHEKLLNEFGQDGLTWMMDVLSSYKLSVDKHYASDYAVFKRGGWLRLKYEEHLSKNKQKAGGYKNRSQQAQEDFEDMKQLYLNEVNDNGHNDGGNNRASVQDQESLPELYPYNE
ncbi:replication protein [Paenibacillus lautus]|uniref:replication protein n=1 Tax=Paenibacillus lautus TaxID=1401 RepID=UPI003D2A1592